MSNLLSVFTFHCNNGAGVDLTRAAVPKLDGTDDNGTGFRSTMVVSSFSMLSAVHSALEPK